MRRDQRRLPGVGDILAGPCKQGSRDLLSRDRAEKHMLSLGQLADQRGWRAGSGQGEAKEDCYPG